MYCVTPVSLRNTKQALLLTFFTCIKLAYVLHQCSQSAINFLLIISIFVKLSVNCINLHHFSTHPYEDLNILYKFATANKLWFSKLGKWREVKTQSLNIIWGGATDQLTCFYWRPVRRAWRRAHAWGRRPGQRWLRWSWSGGRSDRPRPPPARRPAPARRPSRLAVLSACWGYG